MYLLAGRRGARWYPDGNCDACESVVARPSLPTAKLRSLTSPLAMLQIAALFVCLSGCVTGVGEYFRNGMKVGPNYGRPQTAISEDWIDYKNNENKISHAEFDYHWWRLFNDNTLDSLVYTSLRKTSHCAKQAFACWNVCDTRHFGRYCSPKRKPPPAYTIAVAVLVLVFKPVVVLVFLACNNTSASGTRGRNSPGNSTSGVAIAVALKRAMPISMRRWKTTTMRWCC